VRTVVVVAWREVQPEVPDGYRRECDDEPARDSRGDQIRRELRAVDFESSAFAEVAAGRTERSRVYTSTWMPK
jgi:hypothetical protein